MEHGDYVETVIARECEGELSFAVVQSTEPLTEEEFAHVALILDDLAARQEREHAGLDG